MFTFLLVVLILGVQGGLGLSYLRTMEGLSAALYQGNIVPLQTMNTLQKNIVYSRLTMFRYISALEERNIEKLAVEALEEQAVLQELLTRIGTSEMTPEEMTLYEEVVRQWGVLQVDYETIIESSADYADDRVEGIIINNTLMAFNQGAFDQIKKILEQLILDRENQAEQSYEQGLAVVQASQTTTMLTIVIGLVVALLFGIILARAITKPIKKNHHHLGANESGEPQRTFRLGGSR